MSHSTSLIPSKPRLPNALLWLRALMLPTLKSATQPLLDDTRQPHMWPEFPPPWVNLYLNLQSLPLLWHGAGKISRIFLNSVNSVAFINLLNISEIPWSPDDIGPATPHLWQWCQYPFNGPYGSVCSPYHGHPRPDASWNAVSRLKEMTHFFLCFLSSTPQAESSSATY